MQLNIGGMTPFTTIDFPGHLAAVVFLQGCAWRCPYCHNPHLLEVNDKANDWPVLQTFLEARQGFLDGVVFSGGEPLLQSGLAEAIVDVKNMGFKVAIHTAGANPDRLKKYLPLLDWVGLDIKTSFDNYAQVTGIKGSGDKVRQSLDLLLASGIDYEVRTTVDANIFTRNSVLALAETLQKTGVTYYTLQECRDVAGYQMKGPSLLHDHALLAQLNNMFPVFTFRRS